jgi:hypothetical protein
MRLRSVAIGVMLAACEVPPTQLRIAVASGLHSLELGWPRLTPWT